MKVEFVKYPVNYKEFNREPDSYLMRFDFDVFMISIMMYDFPGCYSVHLGFHLPNNPLVREVSLQERSPYLVMGSYEIDPGG